VRLLFDEQLSEDLCALLSDIFPGSLHIRALGAGGASDLTVFQLAHDNDAVLVTKDQDFHRLAVMQVTRSRLSACRSHAYSPPTTV
jgi:predicted nuclease of predicted toxin-antitoxin system